MSRGVVLIDTRDRMRRIQMMARGEDPDAALVTVDATADATVDSGDNHRALRPPPADQDLQPSQSTDEDEDGIDNKNSVNDDDGRANRKGGDDMCSRARADDHQCTANGESATRTVKKPIDRATAPINPAMEAITAAVTAATAAAWAPAKESEHATEPGTASEPEAEAEPEPETEPPLSTTPLKPLDSASLPIPSTTEPMIGQDTATSEKTSDKTGHAHIYAQTNAAPHTHAAPYTHARPHARANAHAHTHAHARTHAHTSRPQKIKESEPPDSDSVAPDEAVAAVEEVCVRQDANLSGTSYPDDAFATDIASAGVNVALNHTAHDTGDDSEDDERETKSMQDAVARTSPSLFVSILVDECIKFADPPSRTRMPRRQLSPECWRRAELFMCLNVLVHAPKRLRHAETMKSTIREALMSFAQRRYGVATLAAITTRAARHKRQFKWIACAIDNIDSAIKETCMFIYGMSPTNRLEHPMCCSRTLFPVEPTSSCGGSCIVM